MQRKQQTPPLPTKAQKRYLRRGLDQPGGKLPLFDEDGQQIATATVESCLRQGWCEPWFENPIKPGWLVCRLTETGREVAVDTDNVHYFPARRQPGA